MQTTVEKAYNILLEAILEDRLPKNSFLSQRKLAKMTDSSIISVREALKKLEHQGIIEAIPQWGVRIPEPTEEKLIETYQVREGIEVMIAYILSQQADERQMEELYRMAKVCDTIEVENEESILHFSKKHRDLHLYMADCTGNMHLKENLEYIGLRMIIHQSAKCTWFQQIENWEYWHRGLLDKIFSGDTHTAQQAMHEHIQHGLRNDLRMFS